MVRRLLMVRRLRVNKSANSGPARCTHNRNPVPAGPPGVYVGRRDEAVGRRVAKAQGMETPNFGIASRALLGRK
jgi:hypothetical protein